MNCVYLSALVQSVLGRQHCRSANQWRTWGRYTTTGKMHSVHATCFVGLDHSKYQGKLTVNCSSESEAAQWRKKGKATGLICTIDLYDGNKKRVMVDTWDLQNITTNQKKYLKELVANGIGAFP